MEIKAIRSSISYFCIGVIILCSGLSDLEDGHIFLGILNVILGALILYTVFKSPFALGSEKRKKFLTDLLERTPYRLTKAEFDLLKELQEDDNL